MTNESDLQEQKTTQNPGGETTHMVPLQEVDKWDLYQDILSTF